MRFRPRFTVRWMMFVVAIVAMILGAEVIRRRSAYFNMLAHSYAQQEEFDQFMLGGGTAVVQTISGKTSELHGPLFDREEFKSGGFLYTTGDASPGYETETLQRRAEHHSFLRRKYERAARYPWLPVDPDPIESK